MKSLLSVGLVGDSLLASDPANAQHADVDWKYYGGVPYDGGELCFYEALSVAHSVDHLRVWTKCLLKDAVSNFQLNDEMQTRAATKIARYYEPPINKVEDIDGNQAAAITIYEEIATNGYLDPPIRVLYEIDCGEGKLRMLSAEMTINGRHGSSNAPGKWDYIGPEGNGAALRKILCDPK
jgi:hypothetical protein